jgi:hypothetical protein
MYWWPENGQIYPKTGRKEAEKFLITIYDGNFLGYAVFSMQLNQQIQQICESRTISSKNFGLFWSSVY